MFTRFLPPKSLPDLPGQWSAFYRRWPQILAESGNTALFDLLPILKRFAPPAKVVDKHDLLRLRGAGLRSRRCASWRPIA